MIVKSIGKDEKNLFFKFQIHKNFQGFRGFGKCIFYFWCALVFSIVADSSIVADRCKYLLQIARRDPDR